jgi:lipid-A-disaccharide synthase
MEREGLQSLFPIEDIAVMGFTAVIGRLPTLLERIRRTADSIVAAHPDALVIVDSPDFTHRVAARVRKVLPALPIVDYVSPSVWAWRPGRARKMRAYVDHLLALLPFEPEAHRRLGGPPTTYVGHPLIERLSEIRPSPHERPSLTGDALNVLVLPGSRRSEISRLMEPFGATLGLLRNQFDRPFNVILPAVPHLVGEITERVRSWPVAPQIVVGEAAKYRAFRAAHAALAASGTVTLELALSGVPMVVAYKVSRLEAQVLHFIHVPSVVLANLVLRDSVVPEFLQQDCAPERLALALGKLLREVPERRAQLEAFATLDQLMRIGDETPSMRAARIVIEQLSGPA